MKVRIEGIGMWKERLGANAFELSLDSESNVKGLMDSLQKQCPDLQSFRKLMIVCVNENVVDDAHQLRDGDEVLLMSALAGG